MVNINEKKDFLRLYVRHLAQVFLGRVADKVILGFEHKQSSKITISMNNGKRMGKAIVMD